MNIKCITWSFILPALVLKIPRSTHILLKFCSDICSYYSFLNLFSKILELIYGILSIYIKVSISCFTFSPITAGIQEFFYAFCVAF